MKDYGLWAFVKRSITPMGQPVRREPRLHLIQRDDVFDLHGKSTLEGFRATHTAIEWSLHDGLKEITIVTGRSGVMRKEFPHWLENHPNVQSITPARCGGSFKVKLKK